MKTDADAKNLIKILIGAAWIDGRIQPEERTYLRQFAKDAGVAEDPEIKPLLHEFKPVKASECYDWVREYLGDRPSSEDCQKLLEAISALIYSDGEVAIEEAKLLTRLQQLDPATNSAQTKHNAAIKLVQKLYRRWIDDRE